MPYLVNGELVPEELIRQEAGRIGRDARWQSIPDEGERARQLRAAAEHCAVDRILIAQLAARDPRPIDPEVLSRELERMKAQWACRSEVDDTGMRSFLERQIRLQRTNQELVASAPKPTAEEVEAFYHANRQNFLRPELFHAAHVVKYVNREQSEEQAFAGIELAWAELERGEPFAAVADRHSDCGDKGGDLGQFPAGHMVEEFEAQLRALAPGQRSGIFRTPFGFHVAELRETTPAGLASLDEVRAEIERVLAFANQHAAYTRAAADLRSCADIRWAPAAQAASC